METGPGKICKIRKAVLQKVTFGPGATDQSAVFGQPGAVEVECQAVEQESDSEVQIPEELDMEFGPALAHDNALQVPPPTPMEIEEEVQGEMEQDADNHDNQDLPEEERYEYVLVCFLCHQNKEHRIYHLNMSHCIYTCLSITNLT